MLLASFSCRLNLCPGIGRTSSRRGNTRGQSSSDPYLDGEIHPVTDPVSLVGGDQVIFADRQVMVGRGVGMCSLTNMVMDMGLPCHSITRCWRMSVAGHLFHMVMGSMLGMVGKADLLVKEIGKVIPGQQVMGLRTMVVDCSMI